MNLKTDLEASGLQLKNRLRQRQIKVIYFRQKGDHTYFFYEGDTLIGTSGEAANTASVLLWGADEIRFRSNDKTPRE